MFGKILRDELKTMAGAYDAANLTPSLIRRLIAAEMQGESEIYIRTDQGIRIGGWDGRTVTSLGGLYIPEGETVWEISSEEDIARKASDDFSKRTKNPENIIPKNTTYIAVTLRSWSKKDSWVSARKVNNKWKDIKAYDVDDIAAWLERWPSVTAWFAWKTGKNCSGILSLEQLEVETRNGIKSSFPQELLLVDRIEEKDSLIFWLLNTESLKILKGDSRLESIMFLIATIKTLPIYQAEQLFSKIVIVESKDALRTLRTPVDSTNQSLIIVVYSDEICITNKDFIGYYKVLQCVDKRFNLSDETVLHLKQQNKINLKQKLEELEFPKVEITRLIKNSHGSFHTLLRFFGDTHTPYWANELNGSKLNALILLGGWDLENVRDLEIVNKLLMGQDYIEFEKLCKIYSNLPDSPVKRTKNCWELLSRIDSWHLLSKYITDSEIKKFMEIAVEVLSELDPQFDIDYNDSLYTGLYIDKIKSSSTLKEGICETLILLSLFGEELDVLRHSRVQDLISNIVQNILIPNWKNWASLHQNLELLAEASPTGFLDAVEKSLNDPKGILEVLNNRSKGIFSSTRPFSDLMRSMEIVCWYKEHLSRAVLYLFQIADADLDYTGNIIVGPINTLSNTIGPFFVQTNASLSTRLKILKSISMRYPKVSWKLHSHISRLLPRLSNSYSYIATPRFRDFIGISKEYNFQDLLVFSTHSCSIFLELTKQDETFQPRLIEVLEQINIDCQKRIINFLIPSKDDFLMQLSWNELNKILTNKVKFPDAKWVISDEIEKLLKEKLIEFTSNSPFVRNKRLFDEHYPIICEKEDDDIEQNRKIEIMRLEALKEVFDISGIDSVLKFASEVKLPLVVGRMLPNLLKDSVVKLFNYDWINEDWFFQFYCGLSQVYFINRPIDELKRIIESLNLSKKFQNITAIIAQQKFERETWNLLDMINNKEVHENYWKKTHVFRSASSEFDAIYIIENLNKNGRANDSAKILYGLILRDSNQLNISSDNIFKLLNDIICSQKILDLKINISSESGYYLARLLEYIESIKITELEEIAILEWNVYPLLKKHMDIPFAIEKWLSSEPTFFCELITFIYKDDEGKVKNSLELSNRSLASDAFSLLRNWKGFPGYNDINFNQILFLKWFEKAKTLNKQTKYIKSGDYELGKILSRAPLENGIWPHIAVADYLENNANKDEHHLCFIGILNIRGVFSKNIGEGGEQERKIANKYFEYAEYFRDTHPKLCRLLDRVSDYYKTGAKKADIDIEKFEW